MKQIIAGAVTLAMVGTSLFSQEPDTSRSDTTIEAMEPLETFEEAGNEMKFFGDYYVGIDEVSVDNIRIFGGDLFVAGRVDGKITVLGGDVTLESTSVINGQIVAIGGSVFKKEGAVVTGKVVEANIKEGISYKDMSGEEVVPKYRNFSLKERQRSLSRRWIHSDTPWFVYNRNEGFLFTPINWHWDRGARSTVRLNFSLGYRFGQQELAGRMTLEKSFFNQYLTLYASTFRETRTDDGYRLPLKENTLAALFARQDFYDRWDEEGYDVGAGLDFDWLRAKGTYHSAEVNSISATRRQARWFQKDRQFRDNLPVVEGSTRSVLGTVMARTSGLEALHSGIGIILDGESILLADNFEEFTRILSMVTANLELAADIVLRSRFLLGTASDILPEFRYFGAGGLGSVSAHPYDKQEGDRMLQTNFELIFLPGFLHKDWLIALFADAAHAWMHGEHGFTDIGTIMDSAVSAIGVGLGDEDMDWRVNIARPLDGRDYWETTLRLNMNF